LRAAVQTEDAAVKDDPADKGVAPAPTAHEQRWPPWLPVPFVVVVIAVVQVLLPPSVTVGPIWLIPVVELLGIPLVWAIWHLSRTDRFPVSDEVLGKAMAAYLCFLAAASALNAALLLRTLLYDVDDTPGRLLVAGFAVLAINVLTFGLIYWWLDGGGPRRRAMGQASRWDFQFPQQAAGQDWTPTMIDYLFTAYTNIIAFSPTDTMPLTHRVKVLFTMQSTISLVTVLVTVSRAINMLPL
jgi:hypothetical protein